MPMAPSAMSRGATWRDCSGKMPKLKRRMRVKAKLAGEHHDGRGGGFGDGVLQPAVQREDRHLDREGYQEGDGAASSSGSGAGRDAVRWRRVPEA